MSNFQIHELSTGALDRDSNLVHDTEVSTDVWNTRKATAGAVADLALEVVASEYDDTASYAIGSYCIYSGVLYRCTTATTGAFDVSDWTAVLITGEYKRVRVMHKADFDLLTPDEKADGMIFVDDVDITASDISYDNTVSGLTADDLQEAVDEVNGKVDDMTTYSTTEKVVGKWVDNKPIYRKYISGSITDGDTLVSGVDTFINAFGVMYIASVGRLIPYYEYFQGASYGATIRKVGTNITASILSNGSSSSAGQSNLFIDYTKA